MFSNIHYVNGWILINPDYEHFNLIKLGTLIAMT